MPGMLSKSKGAAPRHIPTGPYSPSEPRESLCGAIGWTLLVEDSGYQATCRECIAIRERNE